MRKTKLFLQGEKEKGGNIKKKKGLINTIIPSSSEQNLLVVSVFVSSLFVFAAPWRPDCCKPFGCTLAARLLHPFRLLLGGPAAALRSAAPWRPGCCTPFGCSVAARLLHSVRLFLGGLAAALRSAAP
jgi:hypothetical protein